MGGSGGDGGGSRLGPGREFDLIRRFLESAPTSGEAVRVGPGDDAAVLEGGFVVSTDLSVEDVHWRRSWLTPEEIGFRAASAALSDLAAMGAIPVGLLVSMAVSAGEADQFAPVVASGVVQAAREVGAVLLGGDLTASPGPAFLDIVVIGRTDRPVLRSGARPGDDVWVTGVLGGSAGAVAAWRRGDEPPPHMRRAFAHPTPRIREAHWLAGEGYATAMIDLSDGLLGDAGHLAAASGVGIRIDAERVPVHPELGALCSSPAEALNRALSGGEDYEICFTTDSGDRDRLERSFAARFPVRLSRVGEVVPGEGVELDPGGIPGLDPESAHRGFDHFEESHGP